MSTEKNSILIIDDSELVIMQLTKFLSEHYILHTAKDGYEGIKKAKSELPDLILLDIVMPEIDGLIIANMLKATPETKAIPIIFMTSINDKDMEKKGLMAGAVDYINKPVDPDIVQLRIKTHILIVNQMRTIEMLSTTDELTQIPNRRLFETRLETEWKRAKRSSAYVSVMVIDIDFFKNYNDTYGHIQGDVAIKTVASVISTMLLRTCDFAARWGGEEFVVLLPETNAEGALCVAERIRTNIQNIEVPLLKDLTETTKITVSIGINTTIPLETINMTDYIAEADTALYQAKQNGRNCVVVYG